MDDDDDEKQQQQQSSSFFSASVVKFNVGGKKFCSSKQTLLSVPDTFFTGLLSGRIETLKDDDDAIFIDRDPKLFSIILNYLRTRQLHVNYNKLDVDLLRHEAEYYGMTPLIKKLDAYLQVSDDACGGMPFHAILRAPSKDISQAMDLGNSSNINEIDSEGNYSQETMGPVVQVVASNESVLVAHRHHIACYILKTTTATRRYFQSNYILPEIGSVAYFIRYNASSTNLVAIHLHIEKRILLWKIAPHDNLRPTSYVHTQIGSFDLNGCAIDALFFLGSSLTFLIALGFKKGRVGVWHPTSKHWLVQDLSSQFQDPSTITAYHRAARSLIFGSENGTIYFIDMQKFPLRLNNGDLLINKLFQDPDYEEITAISCYLTHSSEHYNDVQNYVSDVNRIEIAYGTSRGTVRILIKHPETLDYEPQLFQTFEIHLSPIIRISLNESYCISVCQNMHVRTWKLTRFRGHISTFPGTTSHANYKLTYLNEVSQSESGHNTRLFNQNCISDNHHKIEPLFDFHRTWAEGSIMIEKLHDESYEISLISAPDGSRLGKIISVDRSPITSVSVEECVLGTKSKVILFTGHDNGNCQVWDLEIGMNQSKNTNGVNDKNDNSPRRDILKAIFKI